MQRALDEIRMVEEKRKLADKEKQTVQAQLAELRKSLEHHTKPILLPTLEAFNATKERLQYDEKLFHFAMAGNVERLRHLCWGQAEAEAITDNVDGQSGRPSGSALPANHVTSAL